MNYASTFFNSELITSNLPPDVSKEISDVSLGISPTIFNLQEYSQTKIAPSNTNSKSRKCLSLSLKLNRKV